MLKTGKTFGPSQGWLFRPEANSYKVTQDIATAKGRCWTKWIKE